MLGEDTVYKEEEEAVMYTYMKGKGERGEIGLGRWWYIQHADLPIYLPT